LAGLGFFEVKPVAWRLKPAQPLFKPAAEDLVRLFAGLEVNAKGCWVWTGYVDKKGYGQIWIDGKARWCHRVMYAAATGKTPGWRHVHHNCHNKACCNPDHFRAIWPKHHGKLSALFRWHGHELRIAPTTSGRKAG
jgi:hypothetical protein